MNKCLRCGYAWKARLKLERHRYKYIERPSKRCALCRSPYWDKMYVRANKNRAPGSIGYQPPLPFLLTPAGKTKIETFTSYRNRISRTPKPSRAGRKPAVATSNRRRAGYKLEKSKHGITKQGKK